MYFDKKMRKNNNKRCYTEILCCDSKNSIKRIGKNFEVEEKYTYFSKNQKGINSFIKKIDVCKIKDEIEICIYNFFNQKINIPFNNDVYELMGSNYATYMVLEDGTILIHTLKKILVTLDFKNYQIIDIEELLKYFKHEDGKYKIHSITDSNQILIASYNNSLIYSLPFKIKYNFNTGNEYIMLYLKYEI